MTYNELAELFKQEGGNAQVCFSVISQNQILFRNNDTKKNIISFKNEEPIKLVKEAQEEPVSEDLEKMSYHSAMNLINNPKFLPTTTFGELISMLQKLYKDGAKWQKEQFEKNRLAHCDAQTEEEAETERDFVMGIIEKEHRQPTFDDAIKYGMKKMKEQMMEKAIDAHCFGFQGAALFSFRLPASNYLVGSEVKVILIKED